VTEDGHTISATFDVTVGPANKLLWVSQPASTVKAGVTWTAFTIEITDQYGNRTSDTDSITITASGSGTLGGTLTKAAVDGLATFNNITYNKVEAITITGSSGALTPTAASSSVSVTAGDLHHFTFAHIGEQEEEDSFSITIYAKDANDNTVIGYTGTGTLTDTTGTISPNSTTGGFTAGEWKGRVTIYKEKDHVTITICYNGITGTSNSFEVD